MRVLFVAPYVPSPIRVRPFEIVRALSRLGHTVSVLALDDGTSGDAARAGLESLCERVEIVPHASWRGALQAALALPTPVPLWSAY